MGYVNVTPQVLKSFRSCLLAELIDLDGRNHLALCKKTHFSTIYYKGDECNRC